MKYLADLHVHSCFSRATAKASRLPGLADWAAIKGIRVIGTGDFTTRVGLHICIVSLNRLNLDF